MWKAATPQEKKPFEDLAAADRTRYNSELSEYRQVEPAPAPAPAPPPAAPPPPRALPPPPPLPPPLPKPLTARAPPAKKAKK